MSRKTWMVVLAGIGAIIMVTGGLVAAAGGGGGRSTGDVGSDSGTCGGECSGDCASCEELGSAQNGAGTAGYTSGCVTYDGNNPTYKNQQDTTGQGLESGIVNNGGACSGSCGSGYHGGCNGTGSCDGNCVDHGGRITPGRTVR